MRLAGLLAGARSPAWREASAAFTFLAAALLASISLAALLVRLLPVTYWGIGWSVLGAGPGFTAPLISIGTNQLPVDAVVSAASWPVVAVLAAMRWRWATAVGAVLGAAAGGAMVAGQYASDPSSVVAAWWQFVLGVTAALAAVIWLAGSGDGSRLLPGRRLSKRSMAVVAAVAAVAAARPAVESAFLAITGSGPGFSLLGPLFRVDGDLRFGLMVLLGGTLLVAAGRLALAVRRRVLLLFLPALAAGILVHWTFGGFLAASSRFRPPVPLTGPQWAALAAVPVLGLVLGVTWLNRHERMLHALATRPSDGS